MRGVEPPPLLLYILHSLCSPRAAAVYFARVPLFQAQTMLARQCRLRHGATRQPHHVGVRQRVSLSHIAVTYAGAISRLAEAKIFFLFPGAVLVISDGVEAAPALAPMLILTSAAAFAVAINRRRQPACCYALAMSVLDADITHAERQLALC